MNYEAGESFAKKLDEADALKHFREKFYFPKKADGEDVLYFTGNSLGLQPKSVRAHIEQELKDWETLGVEAHTRAKNPWLPSHEFVADPLANLVGARTGEVVAMNSLTVNLHLLMISFYRPEGKRRKIMIEQGAFPSDQYAVKSQIKFHQQSVTSASADASNHAFAHANAKTDWLVELKPREGETTLRTEDIEKTIAKNADSLALILLGGVNYYTGQAFDMRQITKVGHEAGAIVAFDLAHAAGNVELHLHEWDVDFAAWCSYKYLNAGPGAIAGVFIHERHAGRFDLPRFAGWWGHDKATRFLMGPEFVPMHGAEGWQISNPPIFQLAALRASLEIFEEAGMKALTEKSRKITGYMEFLLTEIKDERISVITPSDPDSRGCQLSIRVQNSDKDLFQKITAQGVFADWREPDVIRVAPVPLYNTFADVYKFTEILKNCLV